jgi:polysaccharide export outer membrane protein
VRSASVIVLCACLIACPGLGKYVWVDDYVKPTQSEVGFVIGVGDMVLVRVYNQDQLTTKARVRADGKITLPLLNDVVAGGYTPATLGQQLETRYKEFLKLPVVSVSVEEAQPLTIPVGGEVAKPGIVTVDRAVGAGVLQIIVASGGITDFGHKNRIFVLRSKNPPMRIRFTWEALTHGEERAAGFKLQQGDSVVVE